MSCDGIQIPELVLKPFVTFCHKVFHTFQLNFSLYIISELKGVGIHPLSKIQPNFIQDLFWFVWEAFSCCIILTFSAHRWFNYHLIAKLLSNLVEARKEERDRKFNFHWVSNKKRIFFQQSQPENTLKARLSEGKRSIGPKVFNNHKNH